MTPKGPEVTCRDQGSRETGPGNCRQLKLDPFLAPQSIWEIVKIMVPFWVP